MTTEIGFGRIRYIREIVEGWTPGESVRTLGRIQHTGGQVKMEHNGHALKVSTSALGEDLVLKEGFTYMLIGELQDDGEGECALAARVGRVVEGMDYDLFDKALALKREFDGRWEAAAVAGDVAMQG